MSQTFSTSELNILPNLPGFRPRQTPHGPRKAYFENLEGQRFIKDDPSVTTNTLNNLGDDCTTIIIGSPGKKKLSHKDIGKVLTFSAYFEERPDGLKAGNKQIRKCNIFYYLEDDTIKIVEKPQLNSGVTQGTLYRRNAANKSDGSPISTFDFQIGEEIIVAGRTYIIVDCDSATRAYMADNYGFDETLVVPVPEDSYQKYRKSLQAGEEDTWGKFHSKKNDNKTFNEARLGSLADNTGREGFMKFGNSTLSFRCMWDNTQNLYGDILYFSLMYYLSDNTMEIMAIPGASVSTTDGGKTKLLKRSKLPRNFEMSMNLGDRPPASAFFQWTDLYIGLELQVYGRKLLICDADRRTREFYGDNSSPLGDPIVQPESEIIVHKREIPPPTGFGSEEDSLRSVSGSLMPGPVPAKKLGENKDLSFFASLLSGGIDDVNRRFVITYFVTDSTVKVIEPPVRNSGFTGGVFLSRREVKNENGSTLNYRDLFIGCKLRILKHMFLLLDANESTLKWMENNTAILNLPRSSYYAILDKIRPLALSDAKSGELTKLFQEQESPKGGPGQATVDTLRSILSNVYRVTGDEDGDVSEHEMRTILRGAGNKKDTFSYLKFVEQIILPTDEFK